MGIIRHTGEYKTSEKEREYQIKRKKETMYLVIEHYSHGTMKCAYCGESHIEFLTLDHINAEPNKIAEYLGIKSKGGHGLRGALISRNFPKELDEEFQILCYNCNMRKGSHKTSRGFNLTDRSHIDLTLKRVCTKCGVEKTNAEFRLHYGKPHSWCFECIRSLNKKHNKARMEYMINYLGGKCTCCGESNIERLSVEHSNNDGYIHRLDIKNRYKLKSANIQGDKFAFYVLKDLKQGIIWPGLTVHCFNCNCAKGNHGYCPHELERNPINV